MRRDFTNDLVRNIREQRGGKEWLAIGRFSRRWQGEARPWYMSEEARPDEEKELVEMVETNVNNESKKQKAAPGGVGAPWGPVLPLSQDLKKRMKRTGRFGITHENVRVAHSSAKHNGRLVAGPRSNFA